MTRNSWTTPFGLAFLVGSVAALVAGYFTGAGMRGATISELNMANAAAFNSAEPYVDENALVAANREPTAPPPPAPAVQAPAAQPPASTDTREVADDSSPTEAQPDADLPPEPREPSRRRRPAEPPPEDEPGDAPPGIS
jgi:hypothetical protein